MKRLCILLATLSLAVLAVDTNNVSYVEGTDSCAVITPEIRAAAIALMGEDAASNLLHGVELTMRKYDMDMRSDSGRRAWHGVLISETVSTNDLYKIQTYSNKVDGAVWTYKMPFKPVPMVTRKKTYTAMTNGVPARLAAARARRAAVLNAGGTVVTNIVTEVK